MERVRKTVGVLLLAVVFCITLAGTVFAAESGSLWLNITDSADDQRTTVLIVTDTTVTDGNVTVQYDSSVLTYEGIEVAEAYVAMYAVNAEEEGTVRIAWVAPEAWELTGDTACLIQVNFSGTEETSAITMTGTAYGADSQMIIVGEVDTTELEKAIADAKALDASLYTEESYAAVEDALADAEALLAGAASQEQIDAAAEALRTAIAALELKPAATEPTEVPTEEPSTEATTVPATESTTEPATESTTESATEPTTKPSVTPGTGDTFKLGLAIALIAISAVGIVILVILLVKKNKHKGRYAK